MLYSGSSRVENEGLFSSTYLSKHVTRIPGFDVSFLQLMFRYRILMTWSTLWTLWDFNDVGFFVLIIFNC